NSAEIASCGMTTRALRFEIRAARSGIADDHVQRDWWSGWRIALASRSGENAVDILSDCADVIIGKIDGGHGRHSRIPSSFTNHRLDEFARLVVHRDIGSQKVGPALVH